MWQNAAPQCDKQEEGKGQTQQR
eukprot:COSAG05_NODE_24130_length_253_cov_1.324675_1_plen_22_part_10